MEGKKRPESRIPVTSPSPLRRTGSLRLGTCPPIQEHQGEKKWIQSTLSRRHSLQSLNTANSFSTVRDDDADSIGSFSSTGSTMSQCDHAHFALNGTTYSGRCKRYVVHCSPHSTETDDYLTPTQRTNRTIRRLKSLLKDAQADLVEKDKEISRLTKEVVQLRLLKVDLTTDPIDAGDSSSLKRAEGDSVDSLPQTNQTSSSPRPRSCSSPPLAPSLSDSGHFEELNSPKEVSNIVQPHVNQIKTIESIQRQYEDEIRELKEKHNDKVDSLLQRITDVNDRYYALRPLYEDCKEKLNKLEKTNEELNKGLILNHNSKISDLQVLNNELLKEKQNLIAELNELKSNKEMLEVSKFKIDELIIENNELKIKQVELMAIINSDKNETCNSCNHSNDTVLNGNVETGDINVQNITKCDGILKERLLPDDDCVHDYHCCHSAAENSELKEQIAAYVEKLRLLEDQPHNHKQTSQLLQTEEVDSTHVARVEDSVIPELLDKLRVKEEELDNIKAMYRRVLEARKDEPKHDPEMTLQFLKSAFYYFLTDRENATGHLSAIESILGFTDNEKLNIEKAFLYR